MLVQLFEQAQAFLPKFLSAQDQRQLFEELNRFPEKLNYYYAGKEFDANILQGDGYKGFLVVNFSSLEKKAISALVVSNSCDIDPANYADFPRKILFAPLIELGDIVNIYQKLGRTEEQINQKLSAIRRQHVTTMFSLPRLNGIIEESVALLDDVHQQPLDSFLASPRSKLFTLSQPAFWVFLLKLSIHFTRMGEKVKRM